MANLISAALTMSSPLSLIIPAKSHPEVIIQAISARDRQKAEAFAKEHNIPDVRDSYQGKFEISQVSSPQWSRAFVLG